MIFLDFFTHGSWFGRWWASKDKGCKLRVKKCHCESVSVWMFPKIGYPKMDGL